jgi:hypothetical protein
MKLENFKRALVEKTNITYELLEERFDSHFAGYDTLKELISDKERAEKVIDWLCDWDDTDEGWNFWLCREHNLLGVDDDIVEGWPAISEEEN